jgi:hypothetical protein
MKHRQISVCLVNFDSLFNDSYSAVWFTNYGMVESNDLEGMWKKGSNPAFNLSD